MRCIFTGVARDGNGNIVPSSTITPFLAGTSTATSIYTTLTSTTVVNSVTAGDDGSFSFYVDRFDYDREQCFDIQISKTSGGHTWTTWTWYNVDVKDVVLATYTVSSDKTVSTNLGLIPKGVIYAISSGKTLTISGHMSAGNYQIFSNAGSGAGLVQFVGYARRTPVVVTWFGATGDGATDDSAAVQAAFMSVPKDGTDWGDQNGGIIEFPSGSYVVNDVVPYEGSLIRGTGLWDSSIRSTTATYGSFYMNAVNGPGTIVENLHFSTGGGAGTQTAIITYNCNGLMVRGCWFNGYKGIDIRSATDVFVSQNFFECSYGVVIGTSGGGDNPYHIQIEGNEFYNNGVSAIKSYAVQYCVIANNIFYKSGDIGKTLDINSDHGLNIEGNVFYYEGTASSTSAAMYLLTANNISITGNNVYGTVKNGIYVGTSTSLFNFSNNNFVTAEEGIFITSGSTGTISGNTLNTTGNARVAYLNTTSTSINGNTLLNNYASGVTTICTQAGDCNVFGGNVFNATSVTNALLFPTGAAANLIVNNHYLGATNDVVDTDGSNFITKYQQTLTATINPGTVNSGTTYTSGAIACPGAAFGDRIVVAAPYDLGALTVTGYVSASNNIKVNVANATAGHIASGGSGTWTITRII